MADFTDWLQHIYIVGYVDVGCGPWKRAEGRCYLFGNGQGYTWSDARQKCQKAGADLVKIDDNNQHVSCYLVDL
jgi:hypothetical protein